ncbi:type VI secretion system baseplate subunit TssE [Reinekea sp. G2M2-21]|uniref:type VI secretion system baseplate subunit TssE n=1 Tax=Reinekea sp. G2M2-21 TaxID=2788942 RepID=UPI0018AAB68A|nr:type VI secretion system baseplate subunit TssE [Reinekea sp. G2M2-21]MDX1341840.1 type VI secretion system baseplate subunit TssE [Reinekea sp.]MDX1475484.1 type VI secretion system baseplate subunit TssE [Reinekea sp.]
MYALYDVLRGKLANGEGLQTFPGHEDLLVSIHDHLMRLLNARQGVLEHLPDYGLPDLDMFYRELPYSEQDIAFAVKNVIEKYEPRLIQVRVQPRARDLRSCVVKMEISGRLHDGTHVRFQTLFKSNYQAQVMQPNRM